MYETMPGHALRIFALISCEPARERARERGEAGEAGETGGQGGKEEATRTRLEFKDVPPSALVF